MLEEDYLALQENLGSEEFGLADLTKSDAKIVSGISSDVVRLYCVPAVTLSFTKNVICPEEEVTKLVILQELPVRSGVIWLWLNVTLALPSPSRMLRPI